MSNEVQNTNFKKDSSLPKGTAAKYRHSPKSRFLPSNIFEIFRQYSSYCFKICSNIREQNPSILTHTRIWRQSPKVAVVIVAWNSDKYLPDLLRTLDEVDYPALRWRIFFVDNGSEDKSVTLLESRGFHVIKNKRNEGFAKANNQGAQEAIMWGAEYLYFLNPDTEVSRDFLREALKVFGSDEKIGQTQSLTLREGGERCQSWGNCLTFLGFGYSGGDGSSCSKVGAEGGEVEEIGYASGAAMMVPTKIWQKVGGFDEIYESFHEDTDLSLRIRLAGHKVVLAPESRVVHKYQFARSIKNYYFMERNRCILGLKFFKIPTLLLFLPAFFVMEVGILTFSFLTGFWREKIRAYIWLIFHIEEIWAKRSELQKKRKYGDKELAKYLKARIEFQEVMNPILEYMVNPIMRVYWKVVRRLIIW